VTFGGAEVPFQVVPGVLAAQVVLPQGGGELRVAYEGLSPVSDSHYLLPDDLLLRGVDSLWIPLPPQTRTTFGLTVDHPSDFEVWAQGTRVGSEALSGGRTRTEFEHSGALPTLYGSDGYATQVVPWGESTLTVAVWKEHAEHLESLSATAQTAMEGLALLGPYPLQQVQLVESGFRDGRGGYGSVGNVALGWRSVVDGGDVDFVAHELAHGWFGGQVPLAASGRTHGQWNETLAEYVSSWALEAEAAGELRCGWSSRYQGLPDNKDRAIRAVGTVSRRGSDHQAITYAKGALLLTSLEDRIGRERVVVWIESVLEAREGQPSTWTHLTDALAELEPAAAEWLVGALDAVGAPEVVPSGGAVQGDELVLRIDQSGPFALSRIEVGFVDGAGGAVGEPARVELEPGSSTVRLPVREGALGVVLDPDCRTPMRSSRDEPLRFSL
jgi:hypothetical protein